MRPRASGRCDDADVAAAAHIGISLFDIMVKDGRMPKPKLINARTVITG